MHKAWCCLEEVPYCFSRSSVRFQVPMGLKNRRFWPELSVSGLYLQFEFTHGFEMKHKAWCSIDEEPIVFKVLHQISIFKVICLISSSQLKKSSNLTQIGRFRTVNSNLNSSMATKWCTKLEVAKKTWPFVFSCNQAALNNTSFYPSICHFFIVFRSLHHHEIFWTKVTSIQKVKRSCLHLAISGL